MKLYKRLGALLLSAALLTGAALPSLAEPEPADTETPAASQTTPDTETQPETTTDDGETDGTTDSGTQSTDGAQSTDGTGEAAGADGAQEEPADTQPANQTGAEAEDGSIQMPTIQIDAKASILVNAETGEIIHADNERERLYPASCTKIMTALLVLEKCNLDDVVTMQEEDFTDVNNGASNAGLKTGEQITVENLLYCLMLPSGNEAANALARVTAGSVDEFVQMMNDRAKELGCVNTHFVNPNGLHNDAHYSCAYDLYLIAQQAMENSTFATIVNTAQKRLPATNQNEERIISTTNHLILSS